MKINKVEIKNFYSIKNVVLNFDNFKGLVLLEGKNRDTGGSNGSGKSVLIEAVVWGLFGRTIRKSTEDALINLYSKKECSVRITVNNNVVIERGKKPTYLRFLVGEEDKSRDNATNTQKLIEEYLNTNYKVFLATTVFGQQNNIEFISATPDDKRSIIKNFLNLESLFSLRDSVKKLKSNYSLEIKRQAAVINEHTKTIKELDGKVKKVEELKKEVEGKYDSTILDTDLNDILAIEENNRSVEWQIAGIEKEIDALQDRHEDLANQFRNPTSQEICDKCNQPLDVPYHPKHVMYLIRECEVALEEFEDKLSNCNNQLQDAPIPSSQYNKIIEYRDLCSKVETFLLVKDETLQKQEEAHRIKEDHSNKYETMRFWEKAFSEAGLVKYIIRNILKYLNGKTNFYLSHLSKGKFFIEFDEHLKEIITTGGREISYISLSGGEKKKINLAVMLGLQQLLTISHKEENNLMFFDEVAESLDQDGLDGLYILLSELKKNKTLFVITHNNYLKSLMDNVRTLSITKYKGISSLTRR